RGLFGFLTSLVRRLPRTGIDLVDSFLGTLSMEPEVIAAVLHGILVGPVAPEIEERRAITAPTLIIGHENDDPSLQRRREPGAADPACAARSSQIHGRASAQARAPHAGDRPLPRRPCAPPESTPAVAGGERV